MRLKGSFALLILAGCGELREDEAALASCEPGDTITFVFSDIHYARQSDGVSRGFDLDGHVSTAADPEGCYKDDLIDPDGNEGIDNAFAGLVPILEATEAAAVEDLIGDSINNGNLLLMLEISGVQDGMNDDCVDVGLYRGQGVPLIGTDDVLLDGQSFVRDLDLPHSKVSNAKIVDGVLEASPLDIVLPIQMLDEYIQVEMASGGVRLAFDEYGSATGIMGGAVPVSNLMDIVTIEDANIPEGVIPLLAAVADLFPNEDGVCEDFSMALEIEAIPAHFVLSH